MDNLSSSWDRKKAVAGVHGPAKEIPEDKVKVKVSSCQTCGGTVRASVVHHMTTKSKNEFMKEVMEYNLAVKEISIKEYREGIIWCECKK